jgi:fucose permease
VAWGLLAIGAVAMVLFVLFPMPEVQEHKTEGKVSPKEIMSCPAFLSLVLIIGLYFIAEHGIMNWLVSYATNALEVPMGQAANFTAVFFGCVMVGRLVLSSLVDKLGIYRCLRLFATSAAVLYTAGVLLGAPGLWLLAVSGLLFSILYPTLVMLIPRYWPSHAASSASGLVLSVASLADILFNAVFGSLVDAIGYRTSFLIMPACMVGCTALLWLFFAKAKKLERCD